MRRILMTSLLCAAVAYPAAALAQEKATRSVDDYLCAFAGKCGDEAEEEATKDAPATKGFSLARSGAAKPTKDAPATKGFSLSRPGAAKPTKEAPATKAFSLTRAPAKKADEPTKQVAKAAPARQPAAAAPAKKMASATRPATKQVRSAKAGSKVEAARRADLRLSFELGSATLTAQAREEARMFAAALKRPELASKKFVIEGHTDAVGSREANLELSKRRAQAVADFLAAEGVSSDRIEVRGYGSDRPLEGRSATSRDNRRVEAVLAS